MVQKKKKMRRKTQEDHRWELGELRGKQTGKVFVRNRLERKGRKEKRKEMLGLREERGRVDKHRKKEGD